MMSGSGYNIAIVGQTGVGKSSLLNYLLDLDPNDGGAKTGVGAPVTKNGFHQYKHKIKDIPVCVFDSWGLEVGKEDQWTKDLENELKNRGVDQPASKWFHSVFYCIAASSARIQDADIKIIQKFRNEKYQVSVILTKADCVSKEDENALRDSLKKAIGDQNISVIAVCSESKRTRGGYTENFGKKEVQEQSLSDLFDSLEARVPEHCRCLMKAEVNVWKAKMYDLIESDLGYFGMNPEEVCEKIKKEYHVVIPKVQKKGEDAVRDCLKDYSQVAEFMKSQLVVERKKYKDFFAGSKTSNSDFGWSDAAFIPLVILSIPFLPFILRSMRKDEVDKIKELVSKNCENIFFEIDKRVLEIRETLQGVKIKILENN
jgi:GTP-binding protein EngB required for normal cell division